MSKIETLTKRSKVSTTVCVMCGMKAKHVAEVNGHSMCPRCFSDYIEDRVGKRRIRIEKNGSTARSKQTSGSRAKGKQASTGGKTSLLECT